MFVCVFVCLFVSMSVPCFGLCVRVSACVLASVPECLCVRVAMSLCVCVCVRVRACRPVAASECLENGLLTHRKEYVT